MSHAAKFFSQVIRRDNGPSVFTDTQIDNGKTVVGSAVHNSYSRIYIAFFNDVILTLNGKGSVVTAVSVFHTGTYNIWLVSWRQISGRKGIDHTLQLNQKLFGTVFVDIDAITLPTLITLTIFQTTGQNIYLRVRKCFKRNSRVSAYKDLISVTYGIFQVFKAVMRTSRNPFSNEFDNILFDYRLFKG